MGLFNSARRPAKTDPADVPWRILFPPPAPPRKKHPQPTQNALPSDFLITNATHNRAERFLKICFICFTAFFCLLLRNLSIMKSPAMKASIRMHA